MYYRLYVRNDQRTAQTPVDLEGFAVFTCDTAGCDATRAVPFTAAHAFPLRLATDAAVAAGWVLLGADDRCPTHVPAVAQ